MKKHFFKFIIFFFFLTIYIFISAFSYVRAVSSNFYNSFFRLHVIANSNLTYDQDLKLKVRDSVLAYVDTISTDITTKTDFINLINNNLQAITSIAQNTIYEQGYDYPVSVNVENSYFPTRYYSDFALPSGYYDTLKILIGDHNGENWWCVMFPPICFIDLSNEFNNNSYKNLVNNTLSNEEYNIIYSDHSPQYDIKFKLLEELQGLSFLQ